MDPPIETVAKAAADLSPFALFLEADIVVKLVIFGLLGASIWSWAIIIERSRRLKALNAEAKAFEDWFWKSDGVDAIGYQPGDAEDMASAIGRILDDERLRKQLETNARVTAIRQFAPERFGHELRAVYETILRTCDYRLPRFWK